MTDAVLPTFNPATVLAELRQQSPLVHCITNAVVTNFTANAMLALGAAPAMVDIPIEAGEFASIAGGTLINLGTPTAEQREAALEAAKSARAWVLDPVAVGGLSVRTGLAHRLATMGPSIIRGNPSEILALAGSGAGGRGVEATDSPEAAVDAARSLALSAGTVVAVSGPVDHITDGRVLVKVSGGDVLLTKVTGGGCSLGASMAAFLAVSDALTAAVIASAVHARAAERAAAAASGPGSFAVGFIDALATIQPEDLLIDEMVVIEELA